MTARLDSRALNRAALARQHLLEPSAMSTDDMVSHLGGVQAQEPAEPFIGLWSRMTAFDPASLSRLLEERALVRVHLMRRTIHLVTADDAWNWQPRHRSLLRQKYVAVYRRELADVDLDLLATQGRALMSDGESRSLGEVGRALAPNWPGVTARMLGEAVVAALLPMVQIPPRGTWRSTAGARYVPLSSWLDRPPPPESVDADLIRRYLSAYGPAAGADLRAWCGLSGLPASVAAIRDELVSFRDDRGRVLLDLPDAPRPDPDTPAPVRFLPAFDNAILGYHDRSRIIDDEHRGLSVAGQRAVLVDGRVAATWTDTAGQVGITALRPLTRAESAAVSDEADRLTAFLSAG
ncbi:MAG: winged helix DNA-binding domain-containing protein [Actinoplanes sp.]